MQDLLEIKRFETEIEEKQIIGSFDIDRKSNVSVNHDYASER